MTFAPMVSHGSHAAGHAVLRSGEEHYLWLDVDYGTGSATYRLEDDRRAAAGDRRRRGQGGGRAGLVGR